MKKTAFKTFISSFIFSLFVILATNRVFFRAPRISSADTEIPNKNILLFLKSEDLAPLQVASAPAKKIILSKMEDIVSVEKNEYIEEENIQETQNLLPIQIAKKAQEPAQSPEIIAQETSSVQLQAKSEPVAMEESKMVVATNLTDTSSAPSVDSQVEKKVVYHPQNTPSENLDLSASEEVFSDTIPLSKEDVRPQGHIVLAQNDVASAPKLSVKPQEPQAKENVVEQKTGNEPQMLIPLESTNGNAFAKAEVKTAQDVASHQIALTAKNTPISSMNTKSLEASKSEPAKKEKKWQSMKEKQASKEDDDPWVVAKGNKYPVNQMMLEDKKYNVNEKTINKLFSQNAEEKNADEIQLASKTINNLLIPIPEDILNDENLTPQLISSPENQEMKEELKAKGLIKEEPEKDIEKSVQSADKASSDSNSTTTDSGILNSLTSLFSSGNEAPQEIGINEDEDEEENSLFSAFSRKRNKIMSKILPTEIRLSFQPNRAEISGQTLKWIKAFAQKTAEEETVGLEIRIDGTSSPMLQRRRLNLLQNILISEGANPQKISTIFTSREPNSFILRTVRINTEKRNFSRQNNNRYMQW